MSPAPLLEPGEGNGRLVRPYAITAGRTRPRVQDLPLEAMVLTTPEGRRRTAVLSWEHRSIVERCAQALSVAEIAAHADVPLGVARVLVGDLAADGLVVVSGMPPQGAGAADPVADATEAGVPPRHDLDLLERVLHGLRSL